MKLKPLSDRVVIKALEAEETTKGGIILTASCLLYTSIAEEVSALFRGKRFQTELLTDAFGVERVCVARMHE